MTSELSPGSSSEDVKFYDPKAPNFEFSNYYVCKVTIDGEIYPSTEHYYQAQKFRPLNATQRSLVYAKIIQRANTPNIARELASQKIKGGYKWRTDLNEIIREYSDVTFDKVWWDEVKDQVMRKAVWHKTNQHPKVKKLLEDTGSKIIIEASPRDSYWGSEKDGKGENMLGRVWMEVRHLLFGTDKAPYDRSFWVLPGLLLASAYPGSPDPKEHAQIKAQLLAKGINTFVSLVEVEENKKFAPYGTPTEGCTIEGEVVYSRIPIPDRKTLPDAKYADLVDGIMYLIGQHRSTLLHCFGGKGRTGTVACGVLCASFGMTGKEALHALERLFQHRKDKGKVIRLLTKEQKAQAVRVYG